MDINGFQPDFTKKLGTYVYKINVSLIHLKDSTKNQDLTYNITDIGIFLKYIQFNMPVVKIIMASSRDLSTMIRTESPYLIFNLSLYVAKEEKDNTNPMINHSTIYDPVFKDQKLVMINEANSAPAPAEPIDANNQKDKQFNYVTALELYPLNAIENSKEIVNDVFSGCPVAQAISAILGEKIHNKVFMQTPHNSKVIPDIFIPPLGLNQTIPYIQKTYGIYNTGLLYFHDLGEKTWIMDRYDRFEKIPKYENTIIFEVFSTQSPSGQTNGSYKDPDTNQWHVRTQVEPLVIEMGNAQATSRGESFVVQGTSSDEYTYRQEIKSKNATKNEELGRVKKTTPMLNKSSSKNNALNDINSMDSESTYVTFTISKINPVIFSPIKAYKIAYFNTNKSDNRTFVLSDLTMVFHKIGKETEVFDGSFEVIMNLEV